MTKKTNKKSKQKNKQKNRTTIKIKIKKKILLSVTETTCTSQNYIAPNTIIYTKHKNKEKNAIKILRLGNLKSVKIDFLSLVLFLVCCVWFVALFDYNSPRLYQKVYVLTFCVLFLNFFIFIVLTVT